MNVLSTLFDPLAYMPVLDNQLYFKITMKLISVVLTRFMSRVCMSTKLCQQELFQNLKIMMRLISYRCTSCQQE